MNAVLNISNAAKRFGENTALDGASLDLESGEWLALLGPNGAGKTTLVRAIAGRVRLDSGTVELLGEPLNGAAVDRRHLGVVPQEIAVYPLLTAGENLHAWGRLHGLTGTELSTRVVWALEWTGLGERAKEPVKGFSGGMRRRLNLACGVLHSPKVVLLDEPTVGVDPQSRQRIWEMLEELRRQGASLLLTTHQLDEAQEVADRIAIIDHGKVIAEGSFRELLTQTVGTQRSVRLALEEAPVDDLPTGFERLEDGRLECHIDDVMSGLEHLVDEVARHGWQIDDLEILSPTLQSVFLHLTGRELRE
jgi:ABC-2 type transport system ATP-binding protein